jgi:hypothetical protein
MALTSEQITEITNKLAKRVKKEKDLGNTPINYTADTMSDVLQAIDTWLTSNKTNAVTAINTASNPVSLPNKVKKWAFALVVMERCKEDIE